MTKLLIYRFSAMGDVTMLLPVIRGLLTSDNDVEIYLVTRKLFFPIFKDISGLHLIEADLKEKHKGFWGIFRLYYSIKKTVNPNIIIDLHKVIRSYILDFLFKISGYKIYYYSKGRKEKKKLLKSKNKTQLTSSIDRYKNAFVKAGFNFELAGTPLLGKTNDVFETFKKKNEIKDTLIGIAPFAKHAQKIWGIDKIAELIDTINANLSCNFILFGGGQHELDTLNKIAANHTNCFVSANYFNFEEELSIFSHLNLMLSMDSSNMHLAAMAGIPTISVWGATHPCMGFYPYQQSLANIVQYQGELKCRPCSVYGNKKCIYPTIRCMEYISVKEVYNKIISVLKNQTPDSL